jgi:diguanylate cyclase
VSSILVLDDRATERDLLSTVLGQQRAWREQDLDLTMAVNISAHSLRARSNLVETVAELSDLAGTPPGYLTLELTEGALIGAEAAETLIRLQDIGPRMSIDDYGTGFSSLAHLQRLPVAEVKIDRSFVTGLAAATGNEVIVRSTIELAHNLGLTVVAEGVEDANVLATLTLHNCDAAQGFHFARAYPADELARWLVDSLYRARAVSPGSSTSARSASPDGASRRSVGV